MFEIWKDSENWYYTCNNVSACLYIPVSVEESIVRDIILDIIKSTIIILTPDKNRV